MERKMHAGAIKEIYQRARELRNNATHAEEVLWGQGLLEKDQLTVLRFTNEQVEQELEKVMKYIEDFISKRKDE